MGSGGGRFGTRFVNAVVFALFGKPDVFFHSGVEVPERDVAKRLAIGIRHFCGSGLQSMALLFQSDVLMHVLPEQFIAGKEGIPVICLMIEVGRNLVVDFPLNGLHEQPPANFCKEPRVSQFDSYC